MDPERSLLEDLWFQRIFHRTEFLYSSHPAIRERGSDDQKIDIGIGPHSTSSCGSEDGHRNQPSSIMNLARLRQRIDQVIKSFLPIPCYKFERFRSSIPGHK